MRRSLLAGYAAFLALGVSACDRSLADRAEELGPAPAVPVKYPSQILQSQSAPAPDTADEVPPEPRRPRGRHVPPDVNAPVKGRSRAELARLAFNPAGVYRRERPDGVLRIRSYGEHWDAYIVGEAEDGGAATPTTCEIYVQGYLRGKMLVAEAAPFRSKYTDIAKEDLEDFDGLVVIAFDDEGAEVLEQYSDDSCGIGSDLNGYYRKQ